MTRTRRWIIQWRALAARAKKEEQVDEGESVEYVNPLANMDTFMEGYEEEEVDIANQLLNSCREVEMKDFRNLKACQSDDEDLYYRPEDCLCLTLTTNPEDEISELQLAVYEPNIGNLYIHHHFILPSFPLALAWMDLDPSSTSLRHAKEGNFVAIATFDCGIGIYHLDLMNCMEEPSLGGRAMPDEEEISFLQRKHSLETDDMKREELSKEIEEAKKGELLEGSHSDSVTCLGWNEKKRNLLASGSADKTVKLWDILSKSCIQTLEIHDDKVQDLMWHPVEENILLTAGYDKFAKMTDIRRSGSCLKFQLDSDVEVARWNYHNPGSVLCTTESSNLFCFDVRRPDSPLRKEFVSYEGPTTAFDINKHLEGFIATAALDKVTKLWKLDLAAPSLTHITEKNLNCGGMFCVNFSARESLPYLLLAGGEENYAIWNTDDITRIKETFPHFSSL